MSSSNPTQEENEHRRKRVRKGTKSCWECKRRKIKCQLSTEDVPVCSGCLQRGTNCLSQEYPEEHDQPSNNQLGERMGRVELLLEKLLDKVNSYEKEKSIPTPESISNNDVLTPYSSTGNNVYENTPILSLFDNSVLGRKVKVVEPQPTTKVVCGPPSKLDRLRYTLAAQLPSQHDADIVFDSAHCWLLIHALTQTYTSELFFSNGSVNSLNLAEAAKQHPTIIARTLLYLAICMQQLPKTFDQTQLQLTSGIDVTMERYMANGTLITSDDELVSTTEGLECLVLQGVYHINAGNLRRAWLNFRRALNVGQLMGLNKGYTQSVNGNSLEKTVVGTRMWNQFVQGDRYLALLLGMPCGTADLPENFAGSCSQNPELDADQVFNIKMFNISGRIIERNHEEFSHAFARTQEIDERLENLAKEMPQNWWDVPTVMLSDKSMDSAQRFDRIMAQIWFFQLEALLHLPFMLRASKERRYEYSKFSCLRASRQMLDRYLTLRKEGPVSFCCKVMDFGAFTAAVTILLSLLDTSQGIISNIDDQQQRQADKLLIHTVVDSMKELSDTGDIVATQSVDAINTLLCALGDTSGQNSTNLRLSIPYFGTINIFRAVSSATNNTPLSVERQPLLPGENMVPQDIQTLPFASSLPSAPVVSFTSSQFPQFLPVQPIEDWNLQDSDTMFFDGLLNSDLEGNWYL